MPNVEKENKNFSLHAKIRLNLIKKIVRFVELENFIKGTSALILVKD